MNAQLTPSSGGNSQLTLAGVRLEWVLLFCILLVTALVYWPGLWGGFTFDDNSNIVFNTQLHVKDLDWAQWVAATFSSPARELPRPLAMLTFAANHFFTGLNPWPMKATNLALHLLNVILVFGMIRALLRSIGRGSARPNNESIALFVCAVWAVLPINLMAVLLVVQRMEILSHTFVFLGLWLYLVGRQQIIEGQNGWKKILSGLVLCTILGTTSKESAGVLPLYALLIEFGILKFKGQKQNSTRLLIGLYVVVLMLPAMIGVAWLLPKSLGATSFAHRNFSLLERLLTEPHVVADYLRWTIFPDLGSLSLFHDDFPVSRGLLDPPATLLSCVGLFVVGLAAWKIRHTRPLSSVGLAWFFGAHILTATFIPLELMFEHRNYFASAGISLLLADLLLIAPSGTRYRFVAVAAALLMLVFYAGTCHLRALEWSNPLRFAQTEAAKHPQSPRATYNLGQLLSILSNGDANSPFTPAAFEAFDKASAVPNAGILPAQGALLLAARTGYPLQDRWWHEIQDRLRRRPIGPQELGALGALTGCAVSGRCSFPPSEMVDAFAAALNRGDNPEVLNIYANYALNVLDDPDLATRLFKEASALNPRELQYRISMVKLHITLGRYQEARTEIDKIRSLGRFGEFDYVAGQLEVRLRGQEQARNPPSAQVGGRQLR